MFFSDLKFFIFCPWTSVSNAVQWGNDAQAKEKSNGSRAGSSQYTKGSNRVPAEARCRAVSHHGGTKVSGTANLEPGPRLAMATAATGVPRAMGRWQLYRDQQVLWQEACLLFNPEASASMAVQRQTLPRAGALGLKCQHLGAELLVSYYTSLEEDYIGPPLEAIKSWASLVLKPLEHMSKASIQRLSDTLPHKRYFSKFESL